VAQSGPQQARLGNHVLQMSEDRVRVVLGHTAEIIAVIAIVLPSAAFLGLRGGRHDAVRLGPAKSWAAVLPTVSLLFGKHLTRLKIVEASPSLVCDRTLGFQKRPGRPDPEFAQMPPALG